jgi:hypothetical protein
MPLTYIAEAPNPYIFAEGWSNAPLQGYVPPNGVREIPVPLNQSFYIETGSVFVPQLGPSGMTVDAWKTTFVNPGAPAIKKVMLLSDSFDATLNDAYNFFNVVSESGSDVVTNGVFPISVAGTKSGNRRTVFSVYKQMLCSMRGTFTVNQAYFPYTGPNNPVPSNNVNGVQRGSAITFHTQDWFTLYVFAEPQTIRTYLNVLPEVPI